MSDKNEMPDNLFGIPVQYDSTIDSADDMTIQLSDFNNYKVPVKIPVELSIINGRWVISPMNESDRELFNEFVKEVLRSSHDKFSIGYEDNKNE